MTAFEEPREGNDAAAGGVPVSPAPVDPPLAEQDDPWAREMTYPPVTLIGDAVRIGFGILVSLVLMAILPSGWLAWWFALAVLVLTLALLCRTLMRLATRLVMDCHRIELRLQGPRGRVRTMRGFDWQDLTVFRVRHYTARSFNAPVWVEVTIGSPGVRLHADHRLHGFARLLERAWEQSRHNHLPLDRITVDNLTALSLDGRIATADPHVGFDCFDRSSAQDRPEDRA